MGSYNKCDRIIMGAYLIVDCIIMGSYDVRVVYMLCYMQ